MEQLLTAPTPQIDRESVWRWALEKFDYLRDYAKQHAPRSARPTSIVHAVLAKIFAKPTTYLRKLRSKTAFFLSSIRHYIMDKGKGEQRQFPLGDRAAEVPSPGESAAGELDEQMMLFRRTFELMNPEEQQLLHLIAVEELTYREAGNLCGTTEAALRKQMQKTRMRFANGMMLMGAIMENQWGPGSFRFRLIEMRFFRGLSVEALQSEFGCSRKRIETWLDQIRGQLHCELRVLI